MEKHVIYPQGILARNTGKAPLSAEDRLEIHELVPALELAVDSRSWEIIRQILLPTWTYQAAFGSFANPDAFINFITKNSLLFEGIRHQHLNVIVRSQSQDSAVAISYLIVIQVAGVDGNTKPGMPRMVGHGVCLDEFVRDQAGEWRMLRRTVDQQSVQADFISDPVERALFEQVFVRTST
jgi:hypothetical protein